MLECGLCILPSLHPTIWIFQPVFAQCIVGNRNDMCRMYASIKAKVANGQCTAPPCTESTFTKRKLINAQANDTPYRSNPGQAIVNASTGEQTLPKQ
jgi:hypothetical protein